MQRHAHTVDVSIDEDEYEIPTNGIDILLDLCNSEFGVNGFVTYQSIDGLEIEESDLPEEYHDHEFLVCDPVVYREGDEVVVSGNTNFHNMGEGISLRIPEKSVSLESNVDEEFWVKNQHEFEDLEKEEVLDPGLDVLEMVNTGDDVAADWEHGISLDVAEEDEARKLAKILGGEYHEDGGSFPAYSSPCAYIELPDGSQLVPEPDMYAERDKQLVAFKRPWMETVVLPGTVFKNHAGEDFCLQIPEEIGESAEDAGFERGLVPSFCLIAERYREEYDATFE